LDWPEPMVVSSKASANELSKLRPKPTATVVAMYLFGLIATPRRLL
jgi:hypothetical protein